MGGGLILGYMEPRGVPWVLRWSLGTQGPLGIRGVCGGSGGAIRWVRRPQLRSPMAS